MFKRAMLVLLVLLTAVPAYAMEGCKVNLQDDIVINRQSVVLSGNSGKLLITPQGKVLRDGKELAISAATRQQAIAYQAALRRDLPFAHQGISLRLNNAHAALQRILSDELGSDSQTTVQLKDLYSSLTGQVNRVLEPTADGMIFNHKQIPQVTKDTQVLLQNGFGRMLQNSFNELSAKQARSGNNKGNGIQDVFNRLSVLQQSIRNEWQKQRQQLKTFGDEVCGRVINLEQQRATLLSGLPQ